MKCQPAAHGATSGMAEAARPRVRPSLRYIDGRHDFAGVTEDLTAWWPKLCPGGLLGGHDWIGHGDASRAVKGWASQLTDPLQPKHIYISADHPASYFMFKAPTPCTTAS